MQPQPYVQHYPSLRSGIVVVGFLLVILGLVVALPVFVGGVVAWVLGAVDVVLLGPAVVLLMASLRDDIRRDRTDTIQFSIDAEGVYDGRTGTLLPWARVTAVKLVRPTRSEPPAGLVVVGISAPHDGRPVVDDRRQTSLAQPAEVATGTVALFHTTYDISSVRTAIQAFAPLFPIEYTTAKQVRHLRSLMPTISRSTRGATGEPLPARPQVPEQGEVRVGHDLEVTSENRPASLRHRWPPPDLPDPPARGVPIERTKLISAIGVAPDGSWVVSGGERDGTVLVWDTATGAKRASLNGHSWRVWDAAVAPDGQWLATGAHDKTVIVWCARSWQKIAVLAGPSGSHVVFWSVVIAPDGSWLAGADTGGKIWVWDVGTWALIATLTGHNHGVARLAVAPDGSWLALGDLEGKLWIWDTGTWEVRASVQAHPKYCWGVAIAPDGTWLATSGGWLDTSDGGGDRAVRIWDATTLQPRAALRGHTGGVATVAIAPTGAWLASGDHDNGLRVWNPRTGREITSTRLAGKIYTTACLPDGSGLLVGTERGIYHFELHHEEPQR